MHRMPGPFPSDRRFFACGAARCSRLLFYAALAVAASCALSGSLVAAQPNDYYYAGYLSNESYIGIDGNIRQSVTTPLTGVQHHLNQFLLCTGDNCNQWVSTGLYQGYLPNTTSYSRADVFWESRNPCNVYGQDDVGQPDEANWGYYLSYDRRGAFTGSCSGGSQYTYYVIEYRKGSFGSVPFHYGRLSLPYGVVWAVTEMYPDQSVPQNSDFFGCNPSMQCTNPSYGLHLYYGDGSWLGWTSDGVELADSPPYLHAYHLYWAFKTCHTSC
jgi:hypothetical protein